VVVHIDHLQITDNCKENQKLVVVMSSSSSSSECEGISHLPVCYNKNADEQSDDCLRINEELINTADS
jgi:hypothetical protein